MKTTTLADAFAFFGTRPTNPRWSWSAVSPDSRKVAVTLWEHEACADGSVDFFGVPSLSIWTSKPGNAERIRNLQIARDNCDALFHVIWVTARHPDENPLTIAGRYPEEHLMMKLTDLDEETGEFSAVLVDPMTPSLERRTLRDRPNPPRAGKRRGQADRRPTRRVTSQSPSAFCPTCSLALPTTGICDHCT